MRHLLLALSLLLAIGCATVDYTAPELDRVAADHQIIAVLPFAVSLTGTTPNGLAPEDLKALEEADGFAYQLALYRSLLHHTSTTRRHPILVNIQPIETTNRLLAGSGLAVTDAWQMPAEQLAQVLGVDAVVRTTVLSDRFLSDQESLAIHTGVGIFNEVTDWRFATFIPPWITVTATVAVDATLLDGRSGNVLWKVVIEQDTDWARPPQEVVSDVTRSLARRFPYRA